MHRALYLIGLGYLAICGAVVLRQRTHHSAPTVEPTTGTVRFDGSASEWFVAMKPFCNAVEVDVAHSRHPAPTTLEGQGLSAACYALGGKIDVARDIIDRLPQPDRYRAAGIVFDIHLAALELHGDAPVAKRGRALLAQRLQDASAALTRWQAAQGAGESLGELARELNDESRYQQEAAHEVDLLLA